MTQSSLITHLPNRYDPINLPSQGTWPESHHIFDPHSLHALSAAQASGRPLLVEGEPGVGKSQLARAAASLLERPFLYKVIDAHTTLEDLWFRYDAVRRLGEAQLLGALAMAAHTHEQAKPSAEKSIISQLEPERFVIPEAMWWAFDASDATAHHETIGVDIPEDKTNLMGKPAVLLIDEIDKADVEFANSLLESLGNGAFGVPILNKTVGARPEGQVAPLVVITSNGERQLPPRFFEALRHPKAGPAQNPE